MVAGLFCCFAEWATAGALEVNTDWIAKSGVAQVQVDFSLPLTSGEVLNVLTDYEHMHQFVPDIYSVKLIHADENHKLLELKGAVEFFFIEFPIEVVMDVTFLPNGVVYLQSVSGNLKVQGVVKVSQPGSETQVTYSARLQPAFWLPPVVGPALIGSQIKRQFSGQIAEMYRRHSNAAGAAGTRTIDDYKIHDTSAPLSPGRQPMYLEARQK